MRTTTGRRIGTAVAALAVAFGTAVALLGPTDAGASSHREAPLIAADPAVDNTDVYAFVSPDRAGLRHVHRQLHPVRGARTAGPTSTRSRPTRRTTSTSTTTATRSRTPSSAGRSRTSTSGAATRSSTTTGRSPRSTTRTCCSARPTRSSPRSTAARSRGRAEQRAGGAVPGRPGSMPDYGDAARCRRSRPCPAAGRPSPARPTTRSSSTCGSSTCSTAAT